MKRSRLRAFISQGQRGQAYSLAREQDSAAWNAWRRDTDIFGDHLRTRVNLSEADLANKNLTGFKLTNVSWYKADLSRASLRGNDCSHSDFHLAQMFEADLSDGNFRNSRLSRAYLRGANLSRSDFTDSDLRRASLTGADLRRTILKGVDLSSTRGLTQEQIDQSVGDARTRLPSHLTRPEIWTQYDDDDDEAESNDDDFRPLPTTVEASVLAGRLQLTTSPGEAFFTSSVEPSLLRGELVRLVDEVLPRVGNLGQLSVAFSHYRDSLNNSDVDVIILGLRGLTIENIFSEMACISAGVENAEILPDLIGAIRAILVQHYLLVSQSHKWKAFIEKANQSPYRREHKELARQVGEEMAASLRNEPKLCDQAVPNALDSVVSELDISDDAQNLTVFNALASEENILRSFMAWAVKEARRLRINIWAEFHKNLAEAIGKGMARLAITVLTGSAVMALAAMFPHRFGWLIHVLGLLNQVAEGVG